MDGENVRTQGLVWLGIDEECFMKYDLTLSDRPQSDLLRLELTEMPGLYVKGLPVNSYVLDTFEESSHEGVFGDFEKYVVVHSYVTLLCVCFKQFILTYICFVG